VIGSVPKGLHIALAGLVILAAGGITLALIHKGGGGTPSRPGTITAFSVPTAASNPEGITAGSDGNLWFTEYNASKIGRITPGGSISEFPLPTGASGPGITAGPSSITAGPDGNLWFTESGGNQIGRITTAGFITEFPLPPVVHPYGITAGPDGNLWFTEFDGNKIGRLTPGGTNTGFSAPNPLIQSGGPFVRRPPAW